MICIWALRKRNPPSTSISKLGGCESKDVCGHHINHVKRVLLKLSQEESLRTEGWREGTTLASSLEY